MNQIRELINYLNERTKEYDEGCPTISDAEWDNKYFELKQLEEVYHIYYPDSPTQSIQYQVVNSLKKVTHNHDMLSLDKTKSLDEIKDFLGKEAFIASLKMDGLTCSLLYENGKLISGETRGDSKVGELITHNIRVIKNIPQQIPYTERLVIDGEIICDYNSFKKFENDYQNPRAFSAGSIRLLDSKECKNRYLSFVAWEIVEGLEDIPYLSAKLSEVESYGFTSVPWSSVPKDRDANLEEIKDYLLKQAKKYAYPIDGLVFKFNDCRFGKSLGQTSHHARNAKAYKMYDELYETTLKDIKWQVGRSGQIIPIAVFEEVDTGDSIVEKASLANDNILHETLGNPYIGQRIWISKRNTIIPKVEKADKKTLPFSEDDYIPSITFCPICGSQIIIKNEGILYCSNPNCEGRILNKLKHFVSRSGLNIKGISEQTLDKLLDWGWIESAIDIFKLKEYREEWIKKPGFGIKSVDNILNAIESSRENNLDKFIAALGIPLIGASAAKVLANHFGTWEAFIEAVDNDFKFYTLPDFGSEAHSAIMKFDFEEANNIYNQYLTIKSVSSSSGIKTLEGLTFVITGSLSIIKNREELKRQIEEAGGKVVGNVNKKTSYLITNNLESGSAKAETAKKLGVPILSEESFLKNFLT